MFASHLEQMTNITVLKQSLRRPEHNRWLVLASVDFEEVFDSTVFYKRSKNAWVDSRYSQLIYNMYKTDSKFPWKYVPREVRQVDIMTHKLVLTVQESKAYES